MYQSKAWSARISESNARQQHGVTAMSRRIMAATRMRQCGACISTKHRNAEKYQRRDIENNTSIEASSSKRRKWKENESQYKERNISINGENKAWLKSVRLALKKQHGGNEISRRHQRRNRHRENGESILAITASASEGICRRKNDQKKLKRKYQASS